MPATRFGKDWWRPIASLGLGVAVAFGCDSEPRDCDFQCPDGSCPDGMACSDGYCVHDAGRASCIRADSSNGGNAAGSVSVNTPGGGAGGPQGGNAGTRTSGPLGGGAASPERGEGGAAGEAPVGGGPWLPADGGQPNEPCAAADAPSVSVTQEPTRACVGEDLRIPIEISGGVAPFAWSADRKSELLLDAGDGASAALVGAPLTSGAHVIHVSVRDACARQASTEVTLAVREAPVLPKQSLPHACAGLLYRARVNVPVKEGPETWSSGALPSGIQLDPGSGVLSGTPAASGDFAFELTLDEPCGAASESYSIAVHAEGSCPILSLDGTFALPPACRDEAYVAVVKTAAPAGWEALELPPGLELRAEHATTSASLRGVPTAGGTVLLAVAVNGTSTVAGYPLTARDACWLGYVSATDDRLHFRDPLLDSELIDTDRLVSLPESGSVLDFAFSPDGSFAVYSAERGGARALWLLNTRSLEVTPLGLPGQVLDYAWSERGVLAAAFIDAGATRLGGARIEDGEVQLIPSVAAAVDSALEWVGPDAVAYSAASTSNSAIVYFARFTTDGFAEPRLAPGMYVAPRRLPAQSGLFLLDVASSKLDFLVPPKSALSGPTTFAHRVDELVAPDGSATGRANGAAFDIFAPDAASSNTHATPALRVDRCAQVLAWQPPRLACANDVLSQPGTGEVRIFDLDTAGTPSTVVPGVALSVASWRGRRRGFSPSGGWFAYAADDGFVAVELDGIVPGPLRPLPDTAGTIDFEFSSDERVFFVQYEDDWLDAYSLVSESSIHLGAAPTTLCDEEFFRAPVNFCGRSRSRSDFRWSLDRSVVAFVDSREGLRVVDVSRVDRGSSTFFTTGDVKDFAFQPPRPRN